MTSPWKWALLLDGILITKIEDGPEKLLFRKVFSLSPTPPPRKDKTNPESNPAPPPRSPLNCEVSFWVWGLGFCFRVSPGVPALPKAVIFPTAYTQPFFFFLEWNVIPPTPSHFWAWLSCGITDTLGFLFRAQKSFTFYFPFFHE